MCYFMADGIAIWEILFKYQYSLFFRLMLLPFDSIPLADVMANGKWQMLYHLRLMLLPIVC